MLLVRGDREDLVRLVHDLPAARERQRELHVGVIEAVVADHALALTRADRQALDRL